MLNGVRLDQVIKVNGPIKAALQDWLTWMRPNLIDAWENYQYMRYLMWPAYAKAGLPEALMFGILAKESGGKVHAVSNAGAAGPFQFMYHTGLRFGLGSESGFDVLLRWPGRKSDPVLNCEDGRFVGGCGFAVAGGVGYFGNLILLFFLLHFGGFV
jgi:soluble lytic murein transglycosylase-like protein